MPTEERTTKGTERCATHPSRLTVGTCDVCGRPLCVECAVPVRGRVLGPECLSEVLGDDIPATPAPASVATVAFAHRPRGGRVARRRRARDAVPVDEVQHRFGVRRSVGVGGALVDAHRLRSGDRLGTLVRVGSPGAGGAGRRRSSRGRSSPWAPCSPRSTPAVHQAGARAVDRSRRRGCGGRLGHVRKLQVSSPTCLTHPWAGALIEQVTGRSMRSGSCVLEGGQDGEVGRLRHGEAITASKIVMVAGILLLVDSFLSWQKICFDTGVGLGDICAKANAWGGNAGGPASSWGSFDHPADLGRHPIGGKCG